MNVALDKIFPIVDGQSAQLMTVKAQCLFVAGVITEVQKQAVENRAAQTLRPAVITDTRRCVSK